MRAAVDAGAGASLEAVIGLEVHLALRTRSKLFCECAADTFGAEPNSHVCPVCLGLPGALPVANAAAVSLAVRLAGALGCEVAPVSPFARKHYVYPDAPKNFQLSQHQQPLGQDGVVDLGDGPGGTAFAGRRIGIRRCHLEEDAGRLVHPPYADHSLVDLNRAGAPLVELVTDPDLRSPAEARAFLEQVRALAQALEVSDAAPEQGKLRADVNVSLRRPGAPLGTKVEIKNLNSFKSVEAALGSELRRQARRLADGLRIEPETRGWNEGGQRTFVLRSKEGTEDYRYLPEPDLPPLRLPGPWVAAVAAAAAETPARVRERYLALGLRLAEAERIAFDAAARVTFDAVLAAAAADGPAPDARRLANWFTVEVGGALRAADRDWSDALPHAGALARLAGLATAGTLSGPAAKALLPDVLAGAEAETLLRERGLAQISDAAALERLVDEVMAANPDVVSAARAQPKALNALMGRVMQASRGKANPEAVRALLAGRLEHERP
jgi:aspartyl-tRNA(Asn)/glutamyl-tRNA(Gln) amidotransferase subunit B